MIYYQALDAKRRGDTLKAKQYMETALKVNPDDPAFLTHYGSEMMSVGEYDQAEKSFRKVLISEPNAVNANNSLGALMLLRNETDKAEPFLLTALTQNPKDARAYSNLGMLYSQKGENTKAIQHFRQAVKWNPLDGNSYYNLGVLLSQSEKNLEALNNLRQATKAAQQTKDKELAQAVQEAVMQIKNKKQTPKTGNTVGAGRDGKTDNIKKIVKEPPKHFYETAKLAEKYIEEKEYSKVEQIGSKLIESAPDNGLGYYFKGRAFAGKSEFNQALEQYEKAFMFAPENPDLLTEIGKTFLILNNLDGARNAFQKAAQFLSKPSAQIYYYLGVTERKAGNNSAAVEHYYNALKLMPEHVRSLNDLAVLYVMAGEKTDEALRLLRKAYQLSGQHPAYTASLGWALLKTNNITEAITHLENAAQAMPGNTSVKAHLDEALKKKNSLVE